ncbi:hypothetical protein [Gelatiniphilus marinus]|uniref:Uncharacterized protein n=1 Tax=Gelatiniphilus marinus TaxID=1759464 RepID=A0ABW5JTD6_9FLAO
MMEQFRYRRGGGDGERVMIRVGGQIKILSTVLTFKYNMVSGYNV